MNQLDSNTDSQANTLSPVAEKGIVEAFGYLIRLASQQNSSAKLAVVCLKGISLALIYQAADSKLMHILHKEQFLLYYSRHKSELISALKAIVVEKSDDSRVDICKLSNLRAFAHYCTEHHINAKDICRNLLVKVRDTLNKQIIYRSQSDIRQQIGELLDSIQQQYHQGDFLIIGNRFRGFERLQHRAGEFFRIAELDKILTPLSIGEGSAQRLITVGTIFDLYKLSDSLSTDWGSSRCPVSQTVAGNLFTFYHQYIGSYIATAIKNTSLRKRAERSQLLVINYKFKNLLQIGIYERRKWIQILSSYTSCFQAYLHYHSRAKAQIFNTYLQSARVSQTYRQFKRNKQISKIQNTIRSCLSRVIRRRQELENYLLLQKKLYESNQLKYQKGIEQLNTKMQYNLKRNSRNCRIKLGVQCLMKLILIRSRANVQLFEPQQVLQFLNTMLKGNQTFAKLQVEGAMLKVHCLSGKIGTYGISTAQLVKGDCRVPTTVSPDNPNLKEKKNTNSHTQIISSENNLYHFMIDKQFNLYSRGDNSYGQLGIRLEDTQVLDWQRVLICQRVKLVVTHFNKVVCITLNNEVYQWGMIPTNSQQMQIVSTPTRVHKPHGLRHQTIRSVACTVDSILVLTDSLELHEICSGRVKRLGFKYPIDEVVLVATGNEIIQVCYVLGVKIECYDVVKRRTIVSWLRQAYGIGVGSRDCEMDTVLLDSASQENINCNSNWLPACSTV